MCSIHLRRRVLRTIFAYVVTLHKHFALATVNIHPHKEQDAATPRAYKAHVDTPKLAQVIEDHFSTRAPIARMLDGARVCYSCLEDWLGPRARGLQMHCIQKCLGVQFQGIFDDEETIHEVLPVLDTVVNSKEVKEALRGAHLEYILEEVVLRPRPLTLDSIGVAYGLLDEALVAAVFDNLRQPAVLPSACAKRCQQRQQACRLLRSGAAPCHRAGCGRSQCCHQHAWKGQPHQRALPRLGNVAAPCRHAGGGRRRGCQLRVRKGQQPCIF